jgi:hypothetical protein
MEFSFFSCPAPFESSHAPLRGRALPADNLGIIIYSSQSTRRYTLIVGHFLVLTGMKLFFFKLNAGKVVFPGKTYLSSETIALLSLTSIKF